ncbi:MAG TPA: hypothetical protein VHE37_14695 [Nevskiaceae bacterium]|nr:hypothetical protein [Nevskiaceae bacterium]
MKTWLLTALILGALNTQPTLAPAPKADELPLAWQIAWQGDRALLHIHRDNWRALRQIRPMPLEEVVRETTAVAAE